MLIRPGGYQKLREGLAGILQDHTGVLLTSSCKCPVLALKLEGCDLHQNSQRWVQHGQLCVVPEGLCEHQI